jgi:serine/threonine-protein kinase
MAMQNSPAGSTIDVGSVIAGTYTIEALIGRGGMGAVFLASHARLPGKKVAIKVLHAEMSGDEVLARFKREAQIASMLSHPNIVHIDVYILCL